MTRSAKISAALVIAVAIVLAGLIFGRLNAGPEPASTDDTPIIMTPSTDAPTSPPTAKPPASPGDTSDDDDDDRDDDDDPFETVQPTPRDIDDDDDEGDDDDD